MNNKQSSIILGAVVAALLGTVSSIIVINNPGNTSLSFIPCLLSIVAVFVTVWHYTSTNNLTIKAGEGAGLGAIALSIGGILSGILSLGLQAIGVTPSTEEIKALTLETVQKQWKEQGMSAEQIEQAQGMMSGMDWMYNPIYAILMGIVMGAIIGAIFGAVAAAIFKKGNANVE